MERAFRMKTFPARERGFTVIELTVVVGLAGILLSLASLRAATFLGHYRLDRAARQVARDLQLVRTKAITQTASFRVAFTSSSGSYTVQRRDPVTGTWEEHALYSKTASVGSPQPIFIPEPVTINTTATVEFQSRGNSTGQVTVPVRDPALPGAQRTVTVTWSGQIAIN